ncbi:uncharacterized protein HD556DRAFT_1313378 [Suillus plorans]|uniref:Uncharacterized protein n=1 Tax=Suillus plorans TaxID=116603 RepID=A0A9P7DAW7_9AGAM|nr:uncharacterized protein HD556DRAFT_1313378 [Suillus plorans]KAG1786625.1 hypothetical protein HD556DRAFT_1313378 [Suillus plorans]
MSTPLLIFPLITLLTSTYSVPVLWLLADCSCKWLKIYFLAVHIPRDWHLYFWNLEAWFRLSMSPGTGAFTFRIWELSLGIHISRDWRLHLWLTLGIHVPRDWYLYL